MRVRAAHIERVQEAMSERDWAVARDVVRLRLVTGQQLERLHFADLSESSRAVVRRRVLRRLVSWRVLRTLERRVGGIRAGSTGLVYGIDTAGQRLVSNNLEARRPDPPGERYLRHVLDVSELYAAVMERARVGLLRIERFDAEPDSWRRDGSGGLLKPDAHIVVSNETHTDHWWIEVDRATESLPTLNRKLATYVSFYERGLYDTIMPWVLVTVPDAKRASDVVRLIHQLLQQNEELITVALHQDAADYIVRRLSQ
jgi:hypothetical protein